MKTETQTIECKAWNPDGELGLHIVYRFSMFRDRLASLDEWVGGDEHLPFHYGQDADSIARRFVPAAEAIGWTAEVKVEGGPLPSKYGDGDLDEGSIPTYMRK